MRAIATWGQQARESEPAFAAFLVYRGQGAKRSLQRAAREVGKALRLLERWSTRWGWVKRVAVWDLEHQDLWREARIEAIGKAEEGAPRQAGAGAARPGGGGAR